MADVDPQALDPRKGRRIAFLAIAVLFIIGIVQVLSGNSGFVTAETDGTRLGVCGTYGDAVFLDLDDITDVYLADPFDYGTCVEGEQVGKTVSGVYTSDALGQYTVHAYTNVSPCIVVTHPDGILVFNCSSKSLTERMYQELTEACANIR